MTGPYETERRAADAARHIYDSPPGTGAWGDGNHRLLEDACGAAGVQLGAYDHRILLWLAGWEPSTCAVIAGIITRAALSHERREILRQALADGIAYRTPEGHCADCDKWPFPTGICPDHEDDATLAGAYLALARGLGLELGR